MIISNKERDNAAIQKAVQGWWSEDLKNKEERLQWWREARFGCFIHWGVYAIAGGMWEGKTCGYGEHLQRAMKIPADVYKKELIDKFDPYKFDAHEIVSRIRYAGMKYLVITAKHHDGFAMYPSDAYPYDIRMTPFGRDPMMELKEECVKQGIRFGFYYSHAFDWEHPSAPGNDWEYQNPGGDLHLFEGPKGLWFDEHPEMIEATRPYVREKSIPQILELIRKYHPDILWFDTPHKLPVHVNLEILKEIRTEDPTIVVNGRIIQPCGPYQFADYKNTVDRAAEIYQYDPDWETIPTTNESYGYSCFDKSHKEPEHFIRLLVKSVARDGNVLMNIGPKADGTIDVPDQHILEGIGDWFQVNGESIYGTGKSGLSVQHFGETTLKGNKLYLHVFDMPENRELMLAGLINPVKKAYLLSDPDQTPLETKRINLYDTKIVLPDEAGRMPDETGRLQDVAGRNSVVVVQFDGAIKVHPGVLLSPNTPQYLRSFDASYIDTALENGRGYQDRDYLYGFTSPEQMVGWRVRVQEAQQFEIKVKYIGEAVDSATEHAEPKRSSYSLYVGGEQQTREICPNGETTCDTFVFSIGNDPKYRSQNNEYDLILRPVSIEGAFMKLYGLEINAK